MDGIPRLSCRSPPLLVCPVLLFLLPSTLSLPASSLSCLFLSLLNFISLPFLSLCVSQLLCLSLPPSGALHWADLRSCPGFCVLFFFCRAAEEVRNPRPGAATAPPSCKVPISNGKLVEAPPASWHTALAIGSVWGH